MRVLTRRRGRSDEDEDILPHQRVEKDLARVDQLRFRAIEFGPHPRNPGEPAQCSASPRDLEPSQAFVDRADSSAGIDGSIPIRGRG
jgi:hypothetical protein